MQTIEPERMMQQAELQSRERRLTDFPIIDVDTHHHERLTDLLPFFDPLWQRRVQGTLDRTKNFFPGDLGDPYVAGRSKRPIDWQKGKSVDRLAGDPADVILAAGKMGVDLSIIFPTEMLGLGLHPQMGLEVAVAKAYARWMTEVVLPSHPSLRSMLYLPFNHPEESLTFVREFGEAPGVVGFMVTSVREQPVYHNKYMRLYAELEERGLPLAFHTSTPWREPPFDVYDRLVSVYSLGSPLYDIVHLTNLVINGIFERFPRLRVVFLEVGISWLVFIMHRLNNEYMMRSSEAPLLKKRPSEYILESCYLSTQPLELIRNPAHLEAMFEMLRGSERFLYASNYPSWDFDLPSRIYDLPFLTEQEKRQILGGNAMRLFGLEDAVATLRRHETSASKS